MYNQTTSEVLMVRPCAFGYNPQTASNNAFQHKENEDRAQKLALAEFDSYVELLRSFGVKVNVIEDTPEPHTPDSIFPNNWFSTHSDGTMVLYPMFAKNRRLERKQAAIDYLIENYDIRNICDLTGYEGKNMFLEGTGSMVIDREHGMVYACRSPRTHETVLKEFCKVFGWKYCIFSANDSAGSSIYHTNVMMSVGSRFAVVCLESITDRAERDKVSNELSNAGKHIIEISFEQMNNFAGNMLELKSVGNKDISVNQPLLVMSSAAKMALQLNQIQLLKSYYNIVSPELHNIEVNGGGSARCMLAEIFIK